MENISVLQKTDINIDEKVRTYFQRDILSNNKLDTNPVIDNLIAEGDGNLIDYLHCHNLATDSNMVVLSSLHYYYYDSEEMKNVKTVINLQELNQIKQIKSFLHSLFNVLPLKSSFIGCFVDNEKINGYALRKSSSSYHNKWSFDALENDIVSQIPFLNMLYGILDSKTNNHMSRRSVTLLLEANGCQVMDMTELDGLTYFHSQKIRIPYN